MAKINFKRPAPQPMLLNFSLGFPIIARGAMDERLKAMNEAEQRWKDNTNALLGQAQKQLEQQQLQQQAEANKETASYHKGLLNVNQQQLAQTKKEFDANQLAKALTRKAYEHLGAAYIRMMKASETQPQTQTPQVQTQEAPPPPPPLNINNYETPAAPNPFTYYPEGGQNE